MWTYNHEYGNYLQHWGVKGQKWGVRRYQNKDGSLTAAGKTRYAGDSPDKIKADQNEAADRIKYYGGKHAAQNAINQEARAKKDDVACQAFITSALSVVGGVGLTAAMASAGPIVAVPMILGAAGVIGSGTWASIASSKINKHRDAQITYTQDSDAGADYIVGKRRGD